MKPEMSDNTFKKVGDSDERMYGPQKILVCGYPSDEHASLMDFFAAYGFSDFPIVFVTKTDESRLLKEIILGKHRSGYQQTSGTKRAVILSGFTENELRQLLSAYRSEKLPRPLMATLTPTSENWTVKHLLTELSLEAETMKQFQREKTASYTSDNQE